MGIRLGRSLRAVLAGALILGGLTTVSVAALTAGTASASTVSLFSSTTPGTYTVAVPAGVTSVTITAVGGSGGAAVNNGIPGGEGGIITSTATVAPGDQLSVTVGANGVCGSGGNVAACTGVGGSGAGNGGSSPYGYGGGGGGGSAVFDGANPLVVAGGGGGSAQGIGGNADQNGSDLGGDAGTLSGPGAGGNDGAGDVASSGVGMNGGGGGNLDSAGGGGGYFGGGAALDGGAGGGASYPASATQWDTTATPSVTITYVPAAILYAASSSQGAGDCLTPADACTLATALSEVGPGGTIELVTAGTSALYSGGFSVDTSGTSAADPVTIEPYAGVSNPTLDGGSSETVLTIENSMFLDISGVTIQNGHGTYGGGISNIGGTLTVTDSTFSGNSAAEGGAIDNADTESSPRNADGILTVTDSTFSGNSAAEGGAIDNAENGGSGTLTVTDSTFSGNTANEDSGVIDNTDEGPGAGSVTVGADIFDGGCFQAGGTWTDEGYNLTDNPSCLSSPAQSTDVTVTTAADLDLGPLQNNGGSTETILPTSTSPAVGVIPPNTTLNGVLVCPRTDQRGVASVGDCTIGAVEVPQAPQSITFSSLASKTYGAKPFTVAATASSGLPVTFTAGPSSVCTVSGSVVTIKGAGTCTVVASQVGDNDYLAATPVPQSFTVVRAKLTVTANNRTLLYGQPVPVLGYSVTGLVNGDPASVLTGVSCTANVSATSPGGTYPITCAGGTAKNYTVTYVPGTLTIGYGVGILTPVAGTTFSRGTTIPVTFQLTGANGLSIPNALVASLGCISTVTLGCHVAVTFDSAKPTKTAYNSSTRTFTAMVKLPALALSGPHTVTVSVTVNGVIIATKSVTITAE